jgi:hypothetical protein
MTGVEQNPPDARAALDAMLDHNSEKAALLTQTRTVMPSDKRFVKCAGMTLTQFQLFMKGDFPRLTYRFVGAHLSSTQDVMPGRVNAHVNLKRIVEKVTVE